MVSFKKSADSFHIQTNEPNVHKQLKIADPETTWEAGRKDLGTESMSVSRIRILNSQ